MSLCGAPRFASHGLRGPRWRLAGIATVLMALAVGISPLVRPANAATLLTVGGAGDQSESFGPAQPDGALAVRFELTSPVTNLTVTAPFTDLDCINCTGTAYLIRDTLGAGAILVSSAPFNVVDSLSVSFAGLLPADSYFVVVALTSGSAIWQGSSFDQASIEPPSSCVTHGLDRHAANPLNAFPPGSTFLVILEDQNLHYTVTGDCESETPTTSSTSSSSTSSSSSSSTTSSTTSSSSTTSEADTSTSSSSTLDTTSSTSASTTTTVDTSTSTSQTSTSSTSTTSTTGNTPTTTLLREHFQCYEIKPAAMPPTTVTETDAFGSRSVSLRYAHRFCVPSDKNEESIVDPEQHLVGYETRGTPYTKQLGRTIVNQLGSVVLDLSSRQILLVPTAASLQGAPQALVPPTIDHFQCYRTKRSGNQAPFARTTVSVSNALESLTVTLLRPYRLCMPVDKNGEDASAPNHPGLLLCYRTRAQTGFGTVDAQILNQFGPDDVRLIHRKELCIPSTMQ
jgi:hypothetical protein